MSHYGVRATDAEILATAHLLGCDIAIHTVIGDSTDWLIYAASFNLQKTVELNWPRP